MSADVGLPSEMRYTYNEVLNSLKTTSQELEMDGSYTRAFRMDVAIEMLERMKAALMITRSRNIDPLSRQVISTTLDDLAAGYILPARRPDQAVNDHLWKENLADDTDG